MENSRKRIVISKKIRQYSQIWFGQLFWSKNCCGPLTESPCAVSLYSVVSRAIYVAISDKVLASSSLSMTDLYSTIIFTWLIKQSTI